MDFGNWSCISHIKGKNGPKYDIILIADTGKYIYNNIKIISTQLLLSGVTLSRQKQSQRADFSNYVNKGDIYIKV